MLAAFAVRPKWLRAQAHLGKEDTYAHEWQAQPAKLRAAVRAVKHTTWWRAPQTVSPCPEQEQGWLSQQPSRLSADLGLDSAARQDGLRGCPSPAVLLLLSDPVGVELLTGPSPGILGKISQCFIHTLLSTPLPCCAAAGSACLQR